MCVTCLLLSIFIWLSLSIKKITNKLNHAYHSLMKTSRKRNRFKRLQQANFIVLFIFTFTT